MFPLPITYKGIVYPWQCDHNGHMNVMWYVGKFDEATWSLVGLFGGTAAYMKNENRGLVAGEQRILYKRELVPGNRITIRSGFIEVSEKKFKFFHEMTNDDMGEMAAVTFLTGFHIDATTRRSCPMPAEMLERAKQYVTSEYPRL